MRELITKVKKVNPLVLHYTNEVTINDCANVTLALGASPLMSFSYEEVDEIVAISNSVVINIGTMNSSNIELFIKAGKCANKYNKPVILDPVGVFATKTRANFVERLINEIKFSAIRGNVAEIKYIGGFDANGKGVDSFDEGENVECDIKNIAKKLGCVICATGKVDIVTDGDKIVKIYNGTSKLKSITGTGCMSTSLMGAYLGATNKTLDAVAMGILTMSLSGELVNNNLPIGSFKVNLMDNIYTLDEEKIKLFGKVEVI